MTNEAFNYNWKLADGYPASGIVKHKSKVFGTFICGGGSTMGYKLAGFNHLGGVEIDPGIASVYETNHSPKHLYKEDIRSFIKRGNNLPKELFNLDILDGSPPCTSFSMSGNREQDWGKEKMFNEGQTLQRLDDLFFDFIELAELLKPKVVIAENVAGLIAGNAKAYVYEICKAFQSAGYKVQVFILNAASMGVPQRRQRVFFVCRREDLTVPKIILDFKCKPVPFGEAEKCIQNAIGKPLTQAYVKWWKDCTPGRSFSSVHPKESFFNTFKVWKNQVCPTITSTEAGKLTHYQFPNEISSEAYSICGTFPKDFNFLNVSVKNMVGMSVPPVMMANIAYQVYNQWLKNLK